MDEELAPQPFQAVSEQRLAGAAGYTGCHGGGGDVLYRDKARREREKNHYDIYPSVDNNNTIFKRPVLSSSYIYVVGIYS